MNASRTAGKSLVGQFLRSRREAMTPEDIGLRRGAHRRAGGLRREEVAELSGVSTDYIGRLERGSGPWPSNEVLAALARGLRLTMAERDHLFALCGRAAPSTPANEHVDAGIQRILDRLDDTPAQVMGQAGITLRQSPPAVALLGDETVFRGLARSAAYRWFTDLSSRDLYAGNDHDVYSRVQASLLRQDVVRYGEGSLTAQVVTALLSASTEFQEVWNRQEVGLSFPPDKRLEHPEVGHLDLYCQTLVDSGSGQTLLVFTATPGSESHDRLALLTVIATQHLRVAAPSTAAADSGRLSPGAVVGGAVLGRVSAPAPGSPVGDPEVPRRITGGHL